MSKEKNVKCRFRAHDRKVCNMISGISLLDPISSRIIPYYPFFALNTPVTYISLLLLFPIHSFSNYFISLNIIGNMN